MTPAEALLRTARRFGVVIRTDGDDLILEADREPTSQLIDQLRSAKRLLIDALSRPGENADRNEDAQVLQLIDPGVVDPYLDDDGRWVDAGLSPAAARLHILLRAQPQIDRVDAARILRIDDGALADALAELEQELLAQAARRRCSYEDGLV